MPPTDAELDIAYSARGTVSPELFADLMRRYRDASAAAVDGLPGTPGIGYDEVSGEQLDVWGTGPGPRPAFVFLHGGYWRALSRHDSAFMARMLHARGIATVSVDYSLAPGATLEEIVRQTRAAVAWVYHHGPAYGIDPRRIVVGGSSAGGHLTAMTMVGGWQDEYGLPPDVVAAAFPISGLFDIRPLVRTHINEWLGLDDARAAALSPALLVPPTGLRCPAVLPVARHEASGFHRQTEGFHSLWGTAARRMMVPDRNHFDVVLDLADAGTELGRALLALVADTSGRAARGA